MSLLFPSLWVSVPKCHCLLFPSPLYSGLSSHSLSPGQLRASTLETPLVRPLRPLPILLQGSVPQLAGVDGPLSHPSLSSSLSVSRSLVIPDPSPSFADSREESVLGSVLLPSYSIRPDGPGAPRGRRFTFTVSPSIPHGH